MTTYTYSNGNIVAAVTPTGTITYQYDLSKLSQQGDYPTFAELRRYGKAYTRSKNLVTQEKSGNNTTDYTYTFDAEGRIATMNVSSLVNGTYTYQYDCK